MQKNLVIVESPAKAKTIEKFLGKDYKVMSSYGHIRDLKKKELSIDTETLNPDYEVPADKKKVVADLKSNAEKSSMVWLASDEDREGEAISWHLCEVLGLDENNTNRIVFHEITKPAILEAIKHPRKIDMNLVNAQQARRVLDRIVGFKISPILWRKVKPSLSAGRVQSVAVRLIVEREREIQAFKSEPYYRVNAVFTTVGSDGSVSEFKAELDKRFTKHEEVLAFLEKCKTAQFTVSNISKKPLKRTPAPPFTTSTLQQEAARKLGFTVSQTMMVAQHLYENGRITYMRTDSVNLSSLCLESAKEEITKLWGDEYSKPRQYQTHSKGAQEAHEAIRPTYMSSHEIDGTQQEKRLYDLVWKRTAASQMADALIEKTVVTIDISNCEEKFIANGEVIKFDGFIKVYRESADDDDNGQEEAVNSLPNMTEGENLEYKDTVATQRFSLGPARFTEASLVHKLEELGIGRPSTYAPIISTIQQREYVQKGDKKGETRDYTVDTLHKGKITSKTKSETIGNEKGKLVPTDVGTVVTDFLIKYFPNIMDYNFTAKVESEFDSIADGDSLWSDMIKNFYAKFEPIIENTINAREVHKVGERELGIDPTSGRPVFVKIGRFGPVVQIGKADDKEKPRFAQMPADKSIGTITLEEALELFRLPRTVGEFEGSPVVIGVGKYGPYVMHDHKYVSIPKAENPMTVTLDMAVELILNKRNQETQRHLKTFKEEPKLEVMNGRYGPYLCFDGKNYRLPKNLHGKAAELTLEECMEIINNSKKK
ncbi:MAG: type I DNA topoisomerase [Prevotella sp.]|nr:type I DNA topoisomerase [Prevotella sp.]